MSKRHEKVQSEEAQRELTRKEQLLRHRDRERHKKLYTFVGIALGLALALVIMGVAYQFLVYPNTAAAKVGDVSITASQFQKRVRFDENAMKNQLTPAVTGAAVWQPGLLPDADHAAAEYVGEPDFGRQPDPDQHDRRYRDCEGSGSARYHRE